VSSAARDAAAAQRSPQLTSRLGYLLKHAQLRLAELTTAALEPHGVNGRELAVLLVLGEGEPASQQEAAQRLGIDRTSMVAFLDTLQEKGLVERRPHAHDRRRNVVELTTAGRATMRDARRAGDEAERRFLAPLDPAAAAALKRALLSLIDAEG
jgi:DNA-binding MarR family transcriptional regulator